MIKLKPIELTPEDWLQIYATGYEIGKKYKPTDRQRIEALFGYNCNNLDSIEILDITKDMKELILLVSIHFYNATISYKLLLSAFKSLNPIPV